MSNSKVLLLKRKRRTRNKLKSVSRGRLRLSIFRSSKNIYAQIIDDEQNRTLVSSSTLMSGSEYRGKSSVASAEYVGEQIAREASKIGISEVYFDRGGYPYHGRVKAFAEAARRSGMIF
jgi:large subunit ribosomal protein L18